MSSKKLVCFLVISIIYGLIAVGGAHASIVGIKGVVSDAEGTPLVGVKVTAPDFGSIPVTAVTGPDGAYSIPYISFANVVIKAGDEITVVATDTEGNVVEKIHTVTAADITAGQATFNITFVSTTVTVTVAPTVFSADTASTATVTVTVARDEPVTDEIITLRLSPQVGSVDATTTNNGDGTYSAVYTSGGAAGRVTLTATATGANTSGSATVTINAGAPTAISLKAMPDTVSSLASSIITATVSDSKGNGVGGVSLTGTTSGDGAITNFVEDSRIFGGYTATYTASMVDAEGTETITVTTADISAELTVNLTPVPPREVTILIVEGTVFKEDGEIPADNVEVTVTVGANPPQMDTTDEDGNYSVTLFSPLTTVARTGDPVSIVVTDATDAKRGEGSLILNNDYLGEDGTGTVDDGNVTTDIVIPPRSVSVLAVEGVIYSDDGVSPLEDVDVTVTVAVGSTPPQTTTIDADGNYSVTVVNLLGTVASTGDMVSTVVVTDADGAERGRNSLALSNKQLGESGSATVTLDVMTNITLPPKSVNVLVVEGVVYRDDGTTPVGPGVDVEVTVGSNPAQTTQTESDGSFSTTTLDLLAPVASTGDPVLIVVLDGSGERGRESVIFRNVHLVDGDAATVTQNVNTNIGATSGILAVTGIVYLKNGQTLVPAASHLREGDLTVVVTNTTRNLTASGTVDDDGGYDVTFLNLLGIVAETGDSLTLEVEVLNEAGNAVGQASHTLTTAEVAASQTEVNIHTTVPAEVRVLDIIGSVVEIDGRAAGAGLAVTIALEMNGQTMPPVKTLTDATGGYEYTFVDLLNPVAATGDILIVDVLRASDQFRGHARIPLRSYELVDGQITVDPIMLVPPRLELGGLSINPHYTDIQDPVVQELLSLDLAGLAAMAGGITVRNAAGDPLVSLPPGLLLLVSPLLTALGTLQLELPPGFEPDDENIAKEGFGNAITTRPSAWADLPADQRLPGRWLNGDQLNLYLVGAPTITDVTFTLNGSSIQGVNVPAGSTFPYNFQLEEELIALFSANMPPVGAVQLMIDERAPIDLLRSNGGVWSQDVLLTPGSKVSYYYMVELAKPYRDESTGLTITKFPMVDPRNRQIKTAGLQQALNNLVQSGFSTLENVRSVFSVPEVNLQEVLWVGRFNFGPGDDGEYMLDVEANHRGGYQQLISGKMFTVDRTAPTADIMVAIGENAGMYQRDDGSYVAAGHTAEGSLDLTALPIVDPLEPDAYLYQMIRLDAAGNPGAQGWNPVTVAGDMLPLTYMPPHQVQVPIGDVGKFGIRAVGLDSILNISSDTMMRLLEIVPPDPDTAAVTLVHADYNGDGTTDGPFEMEQRVSDGVTIFSDRSNVMLAVELMKQTGHPLKSIAVDFQINGEGDWKPIAMLTGDDLADAESGLEVNWNRMNDFADLLDIRGQATVRVTVINALDVPGESTVTVELVPPALQLGGLSINTGYEVGMERLQALQGLDVTALATNLLGVDPSSLFGPSPLPLALALLGMVSHIQSALPEGFETGDEQIHRENFGNGITPKPIWHPIASADQQDSGRWVNGNQLHLYTFAGPTAESVTFEITGAQTAMASASRVEAGGSFMYNFQLEEELVAIFAGSMPAFAGVTLMIDGQAPIPMVGHAGVWSAAAALTPGKVSYYYRITLAEPHQDMFINRPIQVFPIPDPRNLQMESGYVEQSIIALLEGGIDALATLDPGLRSTFTVPAVDDHSQSLWVGKLDFPADGMYQLDVAVEYSSGSTDALTGKMFTVDRTAPSADTAVHLDNPGENIGMYMRDADGIYVATALPDPGKASLNVSATPIDDSDLETYLYQFARLDDATGTPGTWNPMLTVDLQAQALDLTGGFPLTLEHHVQMLVRSESGSDLDYGMYGLRVVGIDNILNADSSRGPGVVLELVPPDPDVALVTSVQSDFDGNGAIEGLEMQSTSGDVVVFSDSVVDLTVYMSQRTAHPLKSIALEFQLPGGDWNPIGAFGPEQLAATMQGDELSVSSASS